MAYPVFLDLKGKKILIVGGGRIAERKAKALSQEGGQIFVVSRTMTREIEICASENNNVTLVRRYFEHKDLDNVFIAFATTSNQDVNDHVARLCRQKNILVNHCGDGTQSDVKNGARIQKNDVSILIGTGGWRPGVSKWLKKQIEDNLPPELDKMISNYDVLRAEARNLFEKSSDRESFIREKFSEQTKKMGKE